MHARLFNTLSLIELLSLAMRLHAEPVVVAPGVLQLGTLQGGAVTESSGAISSARGRNVFWTHNDGGADNLYAFTTNGQALGQWHIKDVELDNWEDIARQGFQLYIADIGNDTLSRPSVYVYRVTEPSWRFSGDVQPNRLWQLRYTNDVFDAESFFVSRAFGYVIAKQPAAGAAQVYRFPLARKGSVDLQPQFSLNVSGIAVSGAEMAKDNKRLAVITGQGAFLFRFTGRLPASGTVEPTLFVPYGLGTMEGCTFTRDGLLVTAESGEILLFTDELFHATLPRRR